MPRWRRLKDGAATVVVSAGGAGVLVAILLILFYLVIATMRIWMKKPLLPVYLVGAALILPWGVAFSWSNISRFFTVDIIPFPLRAGGDGSLAAFGDWLALLLFDQAWPGMVATIQLTMIALVATGFLTLIFFPLISPLLLGRAARTGGHTFLVIARSTPEYILAFILLNLWGPSMLPAIASARTQSQVEVGPIMPAIAAWRVTVPAAAACIIMKTTRQSAFPMVWMADFASNSDGFSGISTDLTMVMSLSRAAETNAAEPFAE
jgi:hypothetical protein